MTYVKRKFYPDPTPERLHRERIEKESQKDQVEIVEYVPWQINARIISQMKEE